MTTADDSRLPRVTRVGAYTLCVEDDYVLLARLSADGARWTLPGGGVEFGEAPASAAVRETREETGLDVELRGLLGVDSQYLPAFAPPGLPCADYHGVRIVWTAQVVGGDLRDEVDGSTDRADWVRWDDVRRLPLVDLAETALGWLRGTGLCGFPGAGGSDRTAH